MRSDFNINVPAHVQSATADIRHIMASVADWMRTNGMQAEDLQVLEDLVRRIKSVTGHQSVNGSGNKTIHPKEFLGEAVAKSSD